MHERRRNSRLLSGCGSNGRLLSSRRRSDRLLHGGLGRGRCSGSGNCEDDRLAGRFRLSRNLLKIRQIARIFRAGLNGRK